MFSYLRPHHRKTPSNPSSPADRTHAFEPPLHANSPLDHAHPQPVSANSKASPISLPQITRVSSVGSTNERKSVEDMRPWQGSQAGQTTAQDARGNATSDSYVRSPSYVTERRDSAGGASSTAQHSRKSTKPSLVLNQDAFRHANKQVQNGIDMGIHTGRRPTGVRLPTPPLSTVTQGSPFDVPPPKSGSRLNLLNPMSLLARRRTSQAVPQLRPESLVTKQGSDTYDFQIKGKYVHDFSAPRVKRNVSYESRLHSHGGQYANQQRNDSLPLPHIHDILDSPASPWSGGNHTPVFTENFDEEQYPAAGPHVRKTNDFSDLSVPKPPYAKDSARKINDSLDQTTEDLHSRRISYSNLPVSGTE